MRNHDRGGRFLILLAVIATIVDTGVGNSIDGSPHKLGNLPELDDMAVVIVGGANRTEWATAAYDSWLSMFSKKLHVTDVDPDPAAMGRGLASISINVFEQTPTEESQIKAFIHPKNPFLRHIGRQKKGNTHNLGWHLAQPRYLLGLEALAERYPTAKWYLIADSDTFMYPRRIARGLLQSHNPDNEAVGLGTVWKQRLGAGNSMQPCLLGGSGAIVSAAAIRQMNMSDCVRKQSSILRWNKLASDWRLAECMRDGEVEIKAAEFMFMVNDHFNCEPHGPSGCDNFYSRIHRTRTACPYTYHYMDPATVATVFEETILSIPTTQVSLPGDDGKCN